MTLRKILVAFLVAFLIPVGADGVAKKKRRASSPLTVTPRIENTEIGKVKIYQKTYGKKSVDIRIPMDYDYRDAEVNIKYISALVRNFVGRDYEERDYEDGDCPLPTIQESIKMFFKDKDVDSDGLGAGMSVTAFSNSDQYIQIRYARFFNGGNSGHLENEFQIIDKQNKTSIWADDIFQSEYSWREPIISIINSELRRINKEHGDAIFDMLKDDAEFEYWFDKDGMCFWFYRCQISACSNGAITLKIPYDKFKNVIKPEVYQKVTNQTNFKYLPIVEFSKCWDDETFTPYNQ